MTILNCVKNVETKLIIEKKTVFALFPIGDIFLQTYAISKQTKLGMPDTTRIKDLSKGFISITNFNLFFLRYNALWFKKVLKIRHFLFPQGWYTNMTRRPKYTFFFCKIPVYKRHEPEICQNFKNKLRECPG